LEFYTAEIDVTECINNTNYYKYKSIIQTSGSGERLSVVVLLLCCSSIWSSVVEIYHHDGIAGFFSSVSHYHYHFCK